MSKKINDIRIGVFDRRVTDEGTQAVKHICSCGYISEAEYLRYTDIPKIHECPDCGNRTFISSLNVPKDQRIAKPTFFNIETSHKGFEASRTNLSIIHHSENDRLEVIKANLVRRIVFNWINKELKVYRNDELEFDIEKHAIGGPEFKRAHSHLIKGITYSEFFNEIGVPNKEFYKFINRKRMVRQGSSDKQVLESLAYAIENHNRYNAVQVLANAGFKNLSAVVKVYDDSSWRSSTIEKYETKPHKILGVSKKMSKFIRNAELNSIWQLDALKKISKNQEQMRIAMPILEIIHERYELGKFVNKLEDIIYMCRVYNYDATRLLGYIVEDLPMTQGIADSNTAIGLLKDYADMSSKMNIPFEKYPRSLKREHDVTTVNYREYQNKQDTKSFEDAMRDNQYLIDSTSRDFRVLLPRDSRDLIEEGGKLSHCVGSYVDKVVKGSTVIAFMRKATDEGEPYVTLEIANNRVRQARGKNNRPLTDTESNYLSKWAEKRRLYY